MTEEIPPPPPFAPDPGSLPMYAPGAPPPPFSLSEGALSPYGPYAGFWRRGWARILDTLLIGLVLAACLGPAIALLVTGDTERVPCYIDEDGDVIDDDLVDVFDLPPNGTCEELTDSAFAIGFGAGALGFVPYVLYMVWFYRRLGRTGQSPGRKAARVAIVDANTGRPIGAGKAFGRDLLAGNLSAYALGLGFFWVLWDGRKQSWHDKIVTSVVVQVP